MIIENPDIFKTWLTAILEPLCDADPAALAKYVYALVKKDKPVEELREVMIDQLDVFLQAETKPFVAMLFTSLETNEYLKPREVEKPPTPPPELGDTENLELDLELPGTANGSELEAGRLPCPVPPLPPGAIPRHRMVVASRMPPSKAPILGPATSRAPPIEQTLVKVLPLNELLEEPVDQLPRRRDRRNETLREALERRRRRSRSPRSRPRRHPRDFSHDELRRYDARRVSRSPSPRRYRNRSPPTAPDRSRSRSPAPSMERDRLRGAREMERDRMSRDREHRDRASREPDRDRSRSRDLSLGSTSPRPEPRLDHSDTYKRRCRDFDEKGYCMRGDQCQWDHGSDPVVLEENALSRVLAMPPPVPEYNPLVPDIWMGAPPGFAPFPPPHLPPPRELIHIPRTRHEPAGPSGAHVGSLPPRHPVPPHKKNFDYTRLGKGPQRPAPPMNAANCSLKVKKVPRGLNDITHLNNHFSKFGKIVNIQICYEGDPEAALITFSNYTEANVAYKSTEAVLNNRFIKVFWHNPDVGATSLPFTKQDNLVPGGLGVNKMATERGAIHPMSQNKVLINRNNIKATQESKQNMEKEKEKQAANGKEVKTPFKLMTSSDKCKRGRELLDTQLQQQRILIQKLETGDLTPPQKTVIMDAIQSTQDGIETLRKELITCQGSLNLKLQVPPKKPKTREEAQKEILDTELDMFTKQQEGQDVTELMFKIGELRKQMSVQFPAHGNSFRRPHSRGGKFNTAMRYTRGAINKYPGSQSVDHRPRALLISGFETDELESLYMHFSQFGEVVNKEVELSVPQLTLQYKLRAHAEQAALHGRHYNDRTLSITWVTNTTKPAASAPPHATPGLNGDETKNESSQQIDADALLPFEEEDEEELEDRSWRR